MGWFKKKEVEKEVKVPRMKLLDFKKLKITYKDKTIYESDVDQLYRSYILNQANGFYCNKIIIDTPIDVEIIQDCRELVVFLDDKSLLYFINVQLMKLECDSKGFLDYEISIRLYNMDFHEMVLYHNSKNK